MDHQKGAASPLNDNLLMQQNPQRDIFKSANRASGLGENFSSKTSESIHRAAAMDA